MVDRLQAEQDTWLDRPFNGAEQHPLEHTFLYGILGAGRCGLHTGVDIRSAFGTPVLAAAAGEVVYAGDDSTQLFGPSLRYYGKLVLLRLEQGYNKQNDTGGEAPDCETLPVYVLYGHLDQLSVRAGQLVRTGDVVGKVGMTGIAVGPHLHFEVRVGDPGFGATRNPSLWLRPVTGQGAIAGRLVDADGNSIADEPVLVYRGKRGNQLWRVLRSYPDDALINASSLWRENFVLTDVPPGEYVLVAGSAGKYARQSLVVQPDHMSFGELVVPR